MNFLKPLFLTFLLTFPLFAQESGEILYQRCIPCHGENGRKVALGKSSVIAGQSHDLLIQKLTAYQEGTLSIKGMGRLMQAQLRDYTYRDLENLSRYIESLH